MSEDEKLEVVDEPLETNEEETNNETTALVKEEDVNYSSLLGFSEEQIDAIFNIGD